MASDPLEALRCPRGCDPSFLQYLTWARDDGTPGALRIIDARRDANNDTIVDIGLRCGDCGTQFFRRDIPWATKTTLDALHSRLEHLLVDFKDELDDAWLRRRVTLEDL